MYTIIYFLFLIFIILLFYYHFLIKLLQNVCIVIPFKVPCLLFIHIYLLSSGWERHLWLSKCFSQDSICAFNFETSSFFQHKFLFLCNPYFGTFHIHVVSGYDHISLKTTDSSSSLSDLQRVDSEVTFLPFIYFFANVLYPYKFDPLLSTSLLIWFYPLVFFI